MLAMVEIPYTARAKLKELPQEKYEQLRTEIPHLQLPEQKDAYWYCDTQVLLDLQTDGMLLASVGIPFEVKRFKGTYKVQSEGTVHNHIHVAIPAIGLLCMDEVKLLDDACTDELQRDLQDGWRIIAVCPPDAQRRPDYILGRSPEMRKELP